MSHFVQKAAGDKKSAAVRAGAAATLLSLAKTLGRPAEPYLIPQLPWALDLTADKEAATRDAASDAVTYIITEVVAPASICEAVPQLLSALEFSKKWQTKVVALRMVSQLALAAPDKMQQQTPACVPAITPCMNDSKKEVAEQAYATMSDVCKVCGAPQSDWVLFIYLLLLFCQIPTCLCAHVCQHTPCSSL